MLSLQFTYQRHRLVIWRSFFPGCVKQGYGRPKQKLKQQTYPIWPCVLLVSCPCLKHTKDTTHQTSILLLASPCLFSLITCPFVFCYQMLFCLTLVILKRKVRSQSHSQKWKLTATKAECRHWETNVPRPHAENAFVWYSKWFPFNGRKQKGMGGGWNGCTQPQKGTTSCISTRIDIQKAVKYLSWRKHPLLNTLSCSALHINIQLGFHLTLTCSSVITCWRKRLIPNDCEWMLTFICVVPTAQNVLQSWTS